MGFEEGRQPTTDDQTSGEEIGAGEAGLCVGHDSTSPERLGTLGALGESMEKMKYLVVSPGEITVSVMPAGTIGVTLEVPEESGMAQGIGLILNLSVAEARELAGLLTEATDEAEGI